jgi:beta-N-acetylhexosaminidase
VIDGCDAGITDLVGGMFVVGVRGAEPGEAVLESDLAACAEVKIGGVVLFSENVPGGGDRNIRSPDQLARLTGYLRERLGNDTLIAIDQEGGTVSRLGPGHGFSSNVSAAEFMGLDPESSGLAPTGLHRNSPMPASTGISLPASTWTTRRPAR